jgi:hypothetical protein
LVIAALPKKTRRDVNLKMVALSSDFFSGRPGSG